MKTILSLSTITALATVLLTGCSKSDSNYNGDSTNSSSMTPSSSSMTSSNLPSTNSVMDVTNLPAGTK